jgi:hypothetical protein
MAFYYLTDFEGTIEAFNMIIECSMSSIVDPTKLLYPS